MKKYGKIVSDLSPNAHFIYYTELSLLIVSLSTSFD